MGLIEWFGLNPNQEKPEKPDFVPEWYQNQNPAFGENPFAGQYFENGQLKYGTPEPVAPEEPERVPDNELLPDLGENYAPIAPAPVIPSSPTVPTTTTSVASTSMTPLADAQERWLFGGNMSKALVPTLFGRNSTKTDWYRENVWN